MKVPATIRRQFVAEEKYFKICSMCFTKWETRDDFIDDPLLYINGYQAHFERLEGSLFYFTHQKEDCYSTIAIKAEEFLSLYSGKKYKERRTNNEDCPQYCFEKVQLDRCDAFCECAFNREVIEIIKTRQNNKRFQKN
jgi:hypothetical protein